MDLFTLTGIVVINGITEVQGQIDRLMRSAENAARGFSDMSRQVGSSLTSVGNSISGIGDKLTEALTKPIIELTTFGLKYNASMEMMQTNFGVLLSSGEKATILMKKLSDMADVTPFDTEGLSKYTQMLLSMGYTGENVLPMLQKLGDISLGNSEKMGRLTYAVGQIRSNGRLLGSELRQLTELGFNPLEIICKKTGETMEEARERMSDGGISYKEFAATLDEVTSKGGKFYKGMEEGSKTMIGMLSTVKDKAEKMAGAFAKPIFDKLKEILPDVIKLISGVSDGFTKLDGGAKMAILGFAGLVASIGPITVIVGTTVTLLGAFFMALSVLTAPLGLITGAIAVLIGAGALGGLVTVLAGIKFTNVEQLADSFNTIKDKAVSIYDYLKGQWAPAIEYLLTGDKKKLAEIDDTGFRQSLESAREALVNLGTKINEVVDGVAVSFESLNSQDLNDFSIGIISMVEDLADASAKIMDFIGQIKEAYNGLKRFMLEYQIKIGGNKSLGATISEQKDAARAAIELLEMDLEALFAERRQYTLDYQVATTSHGEEQAKRGVEQTNQRIEAKINELSKKEKKFNKKYDTNLTIKTDMAQQQIRNSEKFLESQIKKELKGNKIIEIDGTIKDQATKDKIKKHNDEIEAQFDKGAIKALETIIIDANVNSNSAKEKINKGHKDVKDTVDKDKSLSTTKKVSMNASTNTSSAKNSVNAGHKDVKATVDSNNSLSTNKKVSMSASTNTSSAKSSVNSAHRDVKATVDSNNKLSTTKIVDVKANTDTSSARSSVNSAIVSLISFISGIKLPSFVKTATIGINTIVSGITGRAKGGPAEGLTLVGEEGPELLALPRGSYVYNNGDTKSVLAGKQVRRSGDTGTQSGGGESFVMNGNIIIDAASIKDMNDVINIFKNLKSESIARGGAY